MRTMHFTLHRGLAALTALGISVASSGAVQAMDARLSGAWASAANDCSRLFQMRSRGWAFRPNVTQFEQAYIISTNRVASPAGFCSVARATQSKDHSKLRLNCQNSISFMTMDVKVTMKGDKQMTYGYTGDPVLDVSFVKCPR